MTEVNEISELENETYYIEITENECVSISQIDNIAFYNYTLID